jgi:hypothetical protein
MLVNRGAAMMQESHAFRSIARRPFTASLIQEL